MEQKVGDYVIVHELFHFFTPNHGKLWKSLMRTHLGEYERVEERLRIERFEEGKVDYTRMAFTGVAASTPVSRWSRP
jgi:Protein of unknown function DUF45